MGAQLASRESSLEALITFIGESGGLSKVPLLSFVPI
jgi:hypothetical protein